MMYSKLANFFLYGACPELDYQFYRSYYKDLSHIDGNKDLMRHYIKYGKKEGRFPNEKFAKQNIDELNLSHPNFNIVAYKFYNPDLARSLQTSDEFILHYAKHGRAEGRKCAFDHDGEQISRPTTTPPAGEEASALHDDVSHIRASQKVAARASSDMWKAIFSAPQAMAWFGDAVDPVPTTKPAAIQAFHDAGIEKLWPIELSFIFDPTFYRSVTYPAKSDEMSDADLYRHWLEEGLPADLAPNPQAYLYALLGGAPFPEDFDWRNYASRVPQRGNISKYQLFREIFEKSDFIREDIRPFFKENYYTVLLHIGRHALSNGNYAKAVSVFLELIACSPSSGVYCLLGDAYLRGGRSPDALGAYMKSIELANAPIWSFFNAVDILVDRQNFSAAFDIITKAYGSWAHRVELGRKLDECVGRYFEHESARAHRILREVSFKDEDCAVRGAAERVIEEALDRIGELFRKCDNLPARTGACIEGHLVLLANDDLKQCTHYRIEQKLLQFAAAGIPIRFFSHHDTDGFLDSLVGARATIFYRVAALPHILRCIVHAKAMGLPTYYEIDDLIFDSANYPDSLDSFEGQISREEYCGLQFGVPLFRYALAECDNIIASTPTLARQMNIGSPKQSALILRNALDDRNDIAIQLGAQPVVRTDGAIRIFYGSGTKAHNADFNELVGPALIAIMTRYDHVELVIVGHLKLRAELEAFGSRVIVYPFIGDLDAYWSVLAACDINLAVLHAGIVADCKSEIKWLEAAVLQVPSIVTATATYREVIVPDVDGLLAEGADDWRRHIEMLVNDGGVRRRLGAAAREKALKDYSIEQAASVWKAEFSPIAPVSTAPSPVVRRKMRVMVCNVFFHPQSIGGATRVVEENLRNLLDLYDDIEFAVFCSNEGDTNLGRMRTGHFANVPVFRITTPMEEGMDWRPFNPANKPLFEEALDAFKPDIIHFHCIQRLTASIVEVALERKIPYLVTLHDGWWISDNQFLVDEDGFLQLPTSDVIADCEHSKHPLKSIERRHRLRALLQSADARLSVSGPFAKIYENAGIRDVDVVENGIPALVPSPRQPRTDGRIALGHIGGRAAHKGAFLIEAALRQGDYRNLHLTMIDGNMAPGETVETTWGGTPVTLSGPYPQSKVADLYAGLDVLLAPSTWPESYGLVTREALSLGLWIVASDRGAIGEGVTEGLNGYVIDTTTARDLKQTLHKIDMSHTKYMVPTFEKPAKSRSMVDQANDLQELYKSTLSEFVLISGKK